VLSSLRVDVVLKDIKLDQQQSNSLRYCARLLATTSSTRPHRIHIHTHTHSLRTNTYTDHYTINTGWPESRKPLFHHSW